MKQTRLKRSVFCMNNHVTLYYRTNQINPPGIITTNRHHPPEPPAPLLSPVSGHFPPASPATHLDQRQVRVQVREAVQHHRTGLLRHLQPHAVPNVAHPPRRVKHVEQLSRTDAARLALRPREIDHGWTDGSRALSHGDGGDISGCWSVMSGPEPQRLSLPSGWLGLADHRRWLPLGES